MNRRTAMVTTWIGLAFVLGTASAPGQTCTTELVSASVPNVAANGGSGQVSISASGRYVAFVSHANDLPGVPTPVVQGSKVYIYDTTTQQLALACAGVNGAEPNADCYSPTVSEDGRYVAFQSAATNLPGSADTYFYMHAYVFDRTTGTTRRVDVGPNPSATQFSSYGPVISGNGRFVAFYSTASTLVAGDNNGYYDVFVHDLATSTTTRVSTSSTGAQGARASINPSISADGNFVCFQSDSSNFGAAGRTQVYRKDRSTGALTLVSQTSAGVAANDHCWQSAISSDGLHVAFSTNATNLATGVGNRRQVYVRNVTQPGAVLASRSGTDTPANGDCSSPSVSSGGRYVHFASRATNLVVAPTSPYPAVFVRDMLVGVVGMASITPGGAAPGGDVGDMSVGGPTRRSISDDGRWVAMVSNAIDLAGADRNGVTDVVVRDRLAGMNTLVSISKNGVHQGGGAHSYAPAISGDGQRVVFVSLAIDMTPGNTLINPGNVLAGPGSASLFLRDAGVQGITALSSSGIGRGVSKPALSADGNWLAFEHYDDDSPIRVIYGEIQNRAFVPRDVIAAYLGTQFGGPAQRPALSADGQVVVFDSDSDNLVLNDSNRRTDVFAYDRALARQTIVSRAALGIGGNGDSFDPSVSGDGRLVAFCSEASNLVLPDGNGRTPDIIVADRMLGTLRKLTSPGAGDLGGSYRPRISLNGAVVVFESDAATLVAGDTNGLTDIFAMALATGVVERVSLGAAGVQANGPSLAARLASDGRFVTFESGATNLVPGATTPLVRLYVRDRQAGQTFLVSVGPDGAAANGETFEAAISNDGRRIAFTSYSTNLGFDVLPGTAQVFVREVGCLPAFGCPPDFDGSAGLDSQDIFAFLNAWFAADPRADFNQSGTLESQDIFAFLNAWFAGCA